MIEFILLVAKMRDAQKRYFKTRDREILIESKRLEAEVDRQLKTLDRYQAEVLGIEP